MDEIELTRDELELLYHIDRLAESDPLKEVWLSAAEKYHTLVRTQVDNVEWETVSKYPTIKKSQPPWSKKIQQVLGRLCRTKLIATQPPVSVFLNEHAPPKEGDGAWYYIKEKGTQRVRRELKYGDLGHCLSDDGLIVDWSKLDTAVTEQPKRVAQDTGAEGSGIPPNLYNPLRDVLLDCDPFATNHDLKAIFVDARISPWVYGIPETNNQIRRVANVIDFLYKQHNNEGENALVLFLRVLSDRYDPANAYHQQLTDLASDLEHEIKSRNRARFKSAGRITPHDLVVSNISSVSQQADEETAVILHHRLSAGLLAEIIGHTIMGVGYTYKKENDTYIIIYEERELGRIMLSTQSNGPYFSTAMPHKTGIGERYISKLSQDGFQPIDNDMTHFVTLITMIHERIAEKIEVNDMTVLSQLQQPNEDTAIVNPWDKIPNRSWDRRAVQMLWEGYQDPEIAKELNVTSKTITNRLSSLRQQYPDSVPTRDELRKRNLNR